MVLKYFNHYQFFPLQEEAGYERNTSRESCLLLEKMQMRRWEGCCTSSITYPDIAGLTAYGIPQPTPLLMPTAVDLDSLPTTPIMYDCLIGIPMLTNAPLTMYRGAAAMKEGMKGRLASIAIPTSLVVTIILTVPNLDAIAGAKRYDSALAMFEPQTITLIANSLAPKYWLNHSVIKDNGIRPIPNPFSRAVVVNFPISFVLRLFPFLVIFTFSSFSIKDIITETTPSIPSNMKMIL